MFNIVIAKNDRIHIVYRYAALIMVAKQCTDSDFSMSPGVGYS